MTAAVDALSRLDDGVALPGDRTLADIFDEHCRWGAQRFCLICGTEGQGAECDSCYTRRDKDVDRAADQ